MALFNRLAHALQRMAGGTRRLEDLIDLGAGHVARIDPTDPFSFQMNLEHDLGGCLAVLAEDLLDDVHDELHGREIIV